MTIAHLTNGDSAAGRLREAGLDGPVVVWADVLHDGPVRDLEGDAWRQLRAAFLASAGHEDEQAILEQLRGWDRDLEAASSADEVVLWFEPDLFDQLLLVRHLSRVARGTWTPRRLSLVCRETHPVLGDVQVLGLASPQAVQVLLAEREPIPDAAVDAALRAWTALCADTPLPLVELCEQDLGALPFLREAVGRLFAEFPDARNGLSLTERHALQVLDPWPLEGGQLFRAVQRCERRVFMGDSSFFWRLGGVCTARTPLVAGPAPGPVSTLLHARFGLTSAGAAVLRDDADAVALNGIDRWIGGVHLEGDATAWRYDRARRTLVAR